MYTANLSSILPQHVIEQPKVKQVYMIHLVGWQFAANSSDYHAVFIVI
jgi:hypothetical protein